jgi:hypothetical protein
MVAHLSLPLAMMLAARGLLVRSASSKTSEANTRSECLMSE